MTPLLSPQQLKLRIKELARSISRLNRRDFRGGPRQQKVKRWLLTAYVRSAAYLLGHGKHKHALRRLQRTRTWTAGYGRRRSWIAQSEKQGALLLAMDSAIEAIKTQKAMTRKARTQKARTQNRHHWKKRRSYVRCR